jgi:hypothetical protein
VAFAAPLLLTVVIIALARGFDPTPAAAPGSGADAVGAVGDAIP